MLSHRAASTFHHDKAKRSKVFFFLQHHLKAPILLGPISYHFLLYYFRYLAAPAQDTHVRFVKMKSEDPKQYFADCNAEELLSHSQSNAYSSDEWSSRYSFLSSRLPGNGILLSIKKWSCKVFLCFSRNNDYWKSIRLSLEENIPFVQNTGDKKCFSKQKEKNQQ